MDFQIFLSCPNDQIKEPIRILLSGFGMSEDDIRKLIHRLKNCPQSVTLCFSSSGLTQAGAILLAVSLRLLTQPLTLDFTNTKVPENSEIISRFTQIINHGACPPGTKILGLSTYIRESSRLHELYAKISYARILFSLSPYTTDANDKTKKFPGFPRDIAQCIISYLIIMPLDIAFAVREKIIEEGVVNNQIKP